LKKAVADDISSEILYKLTSKVLMLKDETVTMWMVSEPNVSHQSGSHWKVD
jgi:hypothetical protein